MRFLFLVAFAPVFFACFANAAEPESHWRPPIAAHGPAPSGAFAFALGLESSACGACHPQQHAAWRDSLHARAFSPGLVGQLPAFPQDEQRDCLRCHAPRTDQQSAWFEHGLSTKLDGVDCAACHVRAGVRVGPRAVDVTPHGRVEANALFRRSEFCAACHQFGPEGLALNGKPLENTFEEWKASRYARVGVTCQSCHLPNGRHDFKGIHDPATTRAGLAVRAIRNREGIALTATNAGAGHYLPTYTTPLIRLEIRAGGGSSCHTIRRHLAWNTRNGLREIADTRLAPGAAVSLVRALPPESPGEVVVTVDPGYDYHARIFPDLLASQGATLNRQARALLRSARNTTRGRAYVLYRLRCEPWRGHDTDCVALP